jgi:glycosyltransferase involved in cell wall biosynthesis
MRRAASACEEGRCRSPRVASSRILSRRPTPGAGTIRGLRISLIHPSRGRIARAAEAIREWLSNASGRHEYEYLLSVDDDDPARTEYAALARERGVRLAVHRNRSIVDAVNHAAALSHGDLLIVVSDDFGCPPSWDLSLETAIGGRRNVAVLVNDAAAGHIMTLPIVDREYYESCGYVYYPEYISMFCDDDLTEHARQTGRLIDARHLTFPHRHFLSGAVPVDATYRRQGRGLAWLEGRRVLARRRATNFGAASPSASLALRLLAIDVKAAGLLLGSRLKRRLCGLPPP